MGWNGADLLVEGGETAGLVLDRTVGGHFEERDIAGAVIADWLLVHHSSRAVLELSDDAAVRVSQGSPGRVLTAHYSSVADVYAVELARRFHALPVDFDIGVLDTVEAAAQAQGMRALRLPSGAFHDAQFMVPVCPTGMIFVPSHKGISHNPAEYSSPEQLAAGVRVLAASLLSLARG